MDIVELIATEAEQSASPCKYGNIVEDHACYCHNEADGMPRKCPIWRSHGTNDLTQWRREPWQADDYHIRRVGFRRIKGKQIKVEISELRPTWPEDGCPGFEPA